MSQKLEEEIKVELILRKWMGWQIKIFAKFNKDHQEKVISILKNLGY
jgi:hypothetical protein